MVQGRWSHLNREYSFLTKIQAVFLDGHFMLESFTRFRPDATSISTARLGSSEKAQLKMPEAGSTTR